MNNLLKKTETSNFYFKKDIYKDNWNYLPETFEKWIKNQTISNQYNKIKMSLPSYGVGKTVNSRENTINFKNSINEILIDIDKLSKEDFERLQNINPPYVWFKQSTFSRKGYRVIVKLNEKVKNSNDYKYNYYKISQKLAKDFNISLESFDGQKNAISTGNQCFFIGTEPTNLYFNNESDLFEFEIENKNDPDYLKWLGITRKNKKGKRKKRNTNYFINQNNSTPPDPPDPPDPPEVREAIEFIRKNFYKLEGRKLGKYKKINKSYGTILRTACSNPLHKNDLCYYILKDKIKRECKHDTCKTKNNEITLKIYQLYQDPFKIVGKNHYYNKYITDIENNFLPELVESGKSINLIAGTGSGKTQSLINYANNYKKDLIIFAPTSSIVEQKGKENKIFYINEGVTIWDIKEYLRECRELKESILIISTYDGIIKLNQVGLDYSKIICVIDEIHQFTLAIEYRKRPITALQKASSLFRQVITLTGTPQGAITNNYENHIFFPNEEKVRFSKYEIISHHKGINDLVKVIYKKYSDSNEAKTLLLLDSKKQIEEIKRKLIELGVNPDFIGCINADVKSSYDYRHIIMKQAIKQDTKILLTTCLLADGVDLSNIDIKYIHFYNEGNLPNLLQFCHRSRVSQNIEITDWVSKEPNEEESIFNYKKELEKNIEITQKKVKALNELIKIEGSGIDPEPITKIIPSIKSYKYINYLKESESITINKEALNLDVLMKYGYFTLKNPSFRKIFIENHLLGMKKDGVVIRQGINIDVTIDKDKFKKIKKDLNLEIKKENTDFIEEVIEIKEKILISISHFNNDFEKLEKYYKKENLFKNINNRKISIIKRLPELKNLNLFSNENLKILLNFSQLKYNSFISTIDSFKEISEVKKNGGYKEVLAQDRINMINWIDKNYQVYLSTEMSRKKGCNQMISKIDINNFKNNFNKKFNEFYSTRKFKSIVKIILNVKTSGSNDTVFINKWTLENFLKVNKIIPNDGWYANLKNKFYEISKRIKEFNENLYLEKFIESTINFN